MKSLVLDPYRAANLALSSLRIHLIRKSMSWNPLAHISVQICRTQTSRNATPASLLYVHGIGMYTPLQLSSPLDIMAHRYDFDLQTGKSDTGLKACTYKVEVKTDPEDNQDKVYMEEPEGGTGWKVVELRPVSEGAYWASIRIPRLIFRG